MKTSTQENSSNTTNQMPVDTPTAIPSPGTPAEQSPSQPVPIPGEADEQAMTDSTGGQTSARVKASHYAGALACLSLPGLLRPYRSRLFGLFAPGQSGKLGLSATSRLAIALTIGLRALTTTPRRDRKVRDAVKRSRLNPFSAKAEQMVLGTLLGDGFMQWAGVKNGRYSITHSAVQADYCRSKAMLLADYINTPPRLIRNDGFGDLNCVFSTVTTPAFEPIRTLCYRPAPDHPGRLVKFVNPDWLARLTWEGIAWWYMDDGNLAGKGNCRVAVFSTHRFPREQVELLAHMLTERGIQAKACLTRKQEQIFWTIRVTAASTRAFIEKIKPFMHPSMLYKAETYAPKVLCAFCGELITSPIANLNPNAPCCGQPECKLERNRERNRRWENKPGQRAVKNAEQKARRESNLPEARARANANQRERFADPAYRSKWNARKLAWREKRRLAGLPRM